MADGPDRGHWLRRNDAVWTPEHVICLDSETQTVQAGPAQCEVLRCWAARITYRRDRRRAGEVIRSRGTTGGQAAAAIDAWASYGKSTWLYAHNLAFDLVTTGLAAGLAAAGWELSRGFGISATAPWLVMHKGRRISTRRRQGPAGPVASERVSWDHTLTITDSGSLMPARLADIAAGTQTVKPPLPADDAGLDAWYARCEADVDILAEALLTIMDWWDHQQLGRWSVSGPACGWNSYRHTIATGDVLISQDDDQLAVERAAVYGGRRDVFTTGELPPGRYAEVDFRSAYPMVAAHELLPRKCLGKLTPAAAVAVLTGRASYGIVAEAEIVTDTPRWPLRIADRVFYPVGRFATTLAGPDLIAAHQAGALRRIGAGYLYSMSGHMQQWARWVLSVVAAGDGEVPGPVRIAAKHWSRSVIGKTAQRGWRTDPWVGPPGESWSFEECFIAGSDASSTITGLAGTYYLSVADQPGTHEFPAVLAYVEAHVRHRLCQVIDAAPAGSVLQCDTDGMLISLASLVAAGADGDQGRYPPGDAPAATDQAIATWSALAAPLDMRVKATYRRAVVYGPQHLVLDGRPVFAGVPASAWQTGESAWAARLWPGLSWQIQHGEAEGFTRPVQGYTVDGPYAAGWVLADGTVRPVETRMTPEGATVLVPWHQTRWARLGDQLGAKQGEWAEGMSDGITIAAP